MVPPLPNFVKINFDVVIKKKKTCLAVVVRNNKREVIFSEIEFPKTEFSMLNISIDTLC